LTESKEETANVVKTGDTLEEGTKEVKAEPVAKQGLATIRMLSLAGVKAQ